MKRKRNSDPSDEQQPCDLILTDANGRSIRVHKALLIDRSDYFARILNENNLHELQLNEIYLIELIQYLYTHKVGDQQASNDLYTNSIIDSYDDESFDSSIEPNIVDDDIEILMQLLALSKKYSFRQLYRHLMIEINYKLRPSSAIMIYRFAKDLDLSELQSSTRLMILTWLPRLQKTEAFFSLSEESIQDIFTIETPDVDSECKLNALSSWWSHNKESDMTNLWVELVACSNQ